MNQLDTYGSRSAKQRVLVIDDDQAIHCLVDQLLTSLGVKTINAYSGLSILQAAATMGISARSADRIWAFARAWLYRQLHQTPAD